MPVKIDGFPRLWAASVPPQMRKNQAGAAATRTKSQERAGEPAVAGMTHVSLSEDEKDVQVCDNRRKSKRIRTRRRRSVSIDVGQLSPPSRDDDDARDEVDSQNSTSSNESMLSSTSASRSQAATPANSKESIMSSTSPSQSPTRSAASSNEFIASSTSTTRSTSTRLRSRGSSTTRCWSTAKARRSVSGQLVESRPAPVRSRGRSTSRSRSSARRRRLLWPSLALRTEFFNVFQISLQCLDTLYLFLASYQRLVASCIL